MGDKVSTNRASMIGESFRAMMASWGEMLPYLVGFGVFSAILTYCQGYVFSENSLLTQVKDNPDLLKQDPKLLDQALTEWKNVMLPLLSYYIVSWLGYLVAWYVFTVQFLRTLTTKAPVCSVGGFFQWLGPMIWKFIRPILWILLPIIGIFFYLRSIVRYTLVSPLVIFGRTPALKKSWELTQGNWWRIFFSQMVLVFGVTLAIFAFFFIPALVLGITTHGDMRSPVYLVVDSAVSGIAASLVTWTGAVFSCVAYRILLQERRPVAPTQQVNPS